MTDHTLSILLITLALAASISEDEPDFAVRIRNGDHDAFRIFFEEHYAELERYLRRMGLSEADRQDVVQQSFIAIWNARDRIDVTASLRAYLYRTGRNTGLNHLRDRSRETALPEGIDFADEVTEPIPEEGELRELIQQAVRHMPARRREVFELCMLEGLTYREVAAILEVSPKTVENQMGHALKALRAFAGKHLEQNDS